MPFDNGSVSYRLFHLRHAYEAADLVDRLAHNAAPPIDTLDKDPIRGWVTGKHLLDRQIEEEKCLYGPYLHVQLMKAEKKIPASLLKTYLKIEEEVEKKARDLVYLPRKVKSEIKERIVAQLLPQMPPTLTGIQTLVDLSDRVVLASALSDSQIDAFNMGARSIFGEPLHLLDPDNTALIRHHINPVDLNPVLFTPNPDIEPPHEGTLGMDFLTWLWHDWETGTNTFTLDGDPCGILLEGPLTFYRDGEGAHEALLRNGTPLDSTEAAIALWSGKKLKRAKITLTRAETIVTATVDDTFAFRSLKLPKPEADQTAPYGRFMERIRAIETYWQVWYALYAKFLAQRTNPAQWRKTLKAIADWIQHRAETAADTRPQHP